MPIIQNGLKKIYQQYPLLQDIVAAFTERGATVYIVGGAVRDMLLGLTTKDIDIEVHGLSPKQVHDVLAAFGPVDEVGVSFGVFKLHRLPMDWSLPRKDSAGRKPAVAIDPHMSIKDAFARRDLTMNAMGVNAATGKLVDPFGGQEDIAKKRLRSPAIALFTQDPLRFFRVMHFISRFAMYPDDALNEVCRSMSIAEVSRDRIEQEFHKMLLRSKQPSLGVRWLAKIGRLREVLPELADTQGVVQSPAWHPEGDVFEHSMQALDAAAQETYANEQQKLVGLYAALCHDLGKVTTTTQDDDGIHSYGHEKESERLAKKMLKRITHNKTLIDQVATLVRVHMQPIQLVRQKASLSAYKRLARKLGPALSMQQLAQLVRADKLGRNPKKQVPLQTATPEVDQFLARAKEARVEHRMEPPLLTGKDFLDVVTPGPLLGRVVKAAYELQLDGLTDKDKLKMQALEAAGVAEMPKDANNSSN